MRPVVRILWTLAWLRRNPYVPPVPSPPPPDPPDQDSTDWLSEHNRARALYARPRLAADDQLAEQAALWAAHLAYTGQLSHDGFLGRIRAAGYQTGSENLYTASWPATATEAVEGWMESNKGHRENLLDARWRHVGCGYADGRGGRYWVSLYS